MMNRRKDMTLLTAGLLAGALLAGPAAQAAEGLLALPGAQNFYLNGAPMTLTAYAIDGYNYVKLRDVAQAVDFNVTYDEQTASVHIDPDAPYRGEHAVSITEENVQAALWSLMSTYPNGERYPAPYCSASNGPYGANPSACAGWATLCSDAAFEDLPWRRIPDPSWEEIRPGDLIRYDNSEGGHVAVVLEKTGDYVLVTDSGTANKVYWGGQYFRWWLEEQPGYTLHTRYPE